MTAEHYDPKRLIDLRMAAGLTQTGAARAIGVSRWTIIRAERGNRVSYPILCDLARLYGVPVVSLLHPVSPPATVAA